MNFAVISVLVFASVAHGFLLDTLTNVGLGNSKVKAGNGVIREGVTSFRLCTRANNNAGGYYISPTNVAQLKTSGFDASKKTFFFAHGWYGSGGNRYITNMKKVLLQKMDANFIVVDWSPGSITANMLSAVAKAGEAGVEVARMIRALNSNFGLNLKNIHLIGHSMGATVMGSAGNNLQSPKVGRITGLDPYISATNAKIQLTINSADFVDNIYTTTALTILKTTKAGHVEFYPNNANLGGDWLTDHMKAVAIFTQSINDSCKFDGTQCATWKDYQAGSCARAATNRMGFYASPSGALGTVYLNINAKSKTFGC